MQTIYYEGNSFLHRLNPLSKLVATLPLLVFLALTSDPWTPLAFIILTILLVLILGNIPLRRLVVIAGPALLLVLGFLVFYPLVVRPELVEDTPALLIVGPITIYQGSVLLGLTTGLRIYSLILLSLPFSLTTDSSDFIRALVQQWRLPYKLGYSAMAAFRFLPMLQNELNVIQAAHRVRGVVEKGGLRAQYDRLRRYAIPLLATAIRQAERTALAMDGRAFGAFEQRTYYHQMRFHSRDYLFVGGFWLVTILVIVGLWQAGLLGRLASYQLL